MGLIKKFFNQTRKPEGFLGKLSVKGMNPGHAKLADWGMQYLPSAEVHDMLEIGCGGGRNAGELMKRWPRAKMTAVDYSPVSVQMAAAYNKAAITLGRCTVEQGNVAELRFADESFDLATAFETVYFWPGLERCFAQVYRVLREGGRFLIVNESDGTDKTAKQFESIIEGMHAYTTGEIESALRTAGFSEIRIVHHGKKPWIAVCAGK